MYPLSRSSHEAEKIKDHVRANTKTRYIRKKGEQCKNEYIYQANGNGDKKAINSASP